MASPTRGVQIRTELKCKICQSEHRGEIEDLLAIRSEAGQTALPDGTMQKVTQDWLFEVAPDRWGFKLNPSNITTHYRKHFRKGDPAQISMETKDARAELARRVDAGEVAKKTADEVLDLIISLGHEKIELDPNAITVDHVLKAIGEKTKRKHDESRDRLMETLGGAVAAVAVASTVKPGPPPVDGTAPDEIEAEVVEVVDGD